MPVIREEDENIGVPPVDFADLLNIPETTFAGSNDILGDATAGVDPNSAKCVVVLASALHRVLTHSQLHIQRLPSRLGPAAADQ